MSIVQKTKKFVKGNLKPIAVGTAIGVGLVVAYDFGVRTGREDLLTQMHKHFDMDLRKTFGYNRLSDGKTLKDLGVLDEIPDALIQTGFSDIEDKVKGVLIIQKV